MVKWHPFRVAAAGVVVFCARTAVAQKPSSAAEVAEQRARAGDCVGALDAFDQALRSLAVPELFRDRGMCHEKLGHPFPAIDDYREYLSGRPDAPDAETIRARLLALEEQAGVVKQPPAGSKGGGAEISVSAGGDSSSFSTSAKVGVEAAERAEQLDIQAEKSPLRRGNGLVFGVIVDGRRYFESAFGWAELFGVDIRYSFGPVHTLLLEFEVENVNAGGADSALKGPGGLAGYEARIALNPRVDDALLLGGAFGYQSLSQGASGVVFAFLEPQARVGYRHVFGPSFGLEAELEGGAAIAKLTGNAGSASETTGLFGGHVGVVIGF